jgi:two-component system, NarL family, nitrate/nitrite response regulator NarL
MPGVVSNNSPDPDRSTDAPGPAPASMLVVVIVGGDEPMSAATRQLLARDASLRAVEHTSESALEAESAWKHPDVVLLEVDARSEGAVGAVREAMAKWHPAPVLVLTESEERSRNRRLVRAGARGVVTSSRQAEQLVNALYRVHDGEIWLARSCMSQLIDEMVAGDHPMPAHLSTPEGLDRLTEREREVVALIAQGMHNKAIASELGITDHTVRHHLTAIFAKLGVADRLELAVYAFRHHPGSSPAG